MTDMIQNLVIYLFLSFFLDLNFLYIIYVYKYKKQDQIYWCFEFL